MIRAADELTLDFVASVWEQAEAFLLHCDVGLSRSPAVAAAQSRIYYGDDGQWFELDFPNRLGYDVHPTGTKCLATDHPQPPSVEDRDGRVRVRVLRRQAVILPRLEPHAVRARPL